MTQPGADSHYSYPCTYKGFQLVRRHGRLFGIPGLLGRVTVYNESRLAAHPATVSAATREELEAAIDGYDAGSREAEALGTFEGYRLLRQGGAVYGVPERAGRVDLCLPDERRQAGVIDGPSRREVEERIRGLVDRSPVEFAGWLPIYEASGNCGQHPQFKHTVEPPPGYRFTNSAPPKKHDPSLCQRACRRLGQLMRGMLVGFWMLARPFLGIFRGGARGGLRGRLRVLGAVIRLFCTLRRNGARLIPILRFLRARHYQSQLLLANNRGLVFLTSMPYTYGQNPWMIEIEDPTTLFYPHIQNGYTSCLQVAASPYFPIVKTLLESTQCKGILTHIKSTAAMIATLFDSDTIRKKIMYAPLGVTFPRRWQRHEESEQINLVFINSWCQVPENFYVRGGLDVLEAFAILHERYPQLRLTLRTNLPPLDDHYHRILEAGWVRVIHRFLPAEEMDALLADSHVFLLPAARVHIVSLMQAMSYGLAVVASDGWGIEEYVNHERNGLIVKGRYGKTSWADEKAGILRENYLPMLTPDPDVVEGIVEAVSRLVEDRHLRKRLGRTARRDVETTYSLERWNHGLKEALDRALTPGRDLPQCTGTPHGRQANHFPDRSDQDAPAAAPSAT
jgi:glycosyltransferase involved in cell wall biosynthesis